MNRTIGLALIIISLMIAPSAEPQSNDFIEHNQTFLSNDKYESLIEAGKRALITHPNNSEIKHTIEMIYIEYALKLKKDGYPELAIPLLERASELNTGNETLHTLLALLYYAQGDLFNAKKEINIALIYKSNDPALLRLSAKINGLLEDYDQAIDNYITLNTGLTKTIDADKIERLKKEKQIVTDYKKISAHPFVIYYPDESYEERAQWVSEALVDGYLRLESWLGFTAQHEIVVYLFPTRQTFLEPHALKYAIGIYDGKIRLLVNHNNEIALRQTAVHELTHHALSSLTCRNTPFWLNEGLAQYTACESAGEISEANDFLQYENLENPEICTMSFDTVRIAYIQSYYTIDYLITNYGHGIIVDLVNGLKRGADPESVIEDITLLNYDDMRAEVSNFYSTAQKRVIGRKTAENRPA
ncbi:MAG: hypothetical protein C4541_07595 [Candidatus Auribacter fodinae]|uniref:Peptidase MA-like domain-containing protein n=1 Tax=Candidatus Auribacter fodinae TaxID=2093366 RepID=A0A3A4R797_9BACT|nr:MAG: hypothetical protein C4541_07595 [Candidatus Auribacter fodinae]